jgi:hypothetical protein
MYIVSANDWLIGIVYPWMSIHTEPCSKLLCEHIFHSRQSCALCHGSHDADMCFGCFAAAGTCLEAQCREEYNTNEND